MTIQKYISILILTFLLSACGGGNSDSSDSSRSGSSPATPPVSGSQSVSLSWVAPTTNTDNSALTDLSGYYVYMKKDNGNFQRIGTVNNALLTDYQVLSLSSGDYIFSVSAFNATGVESSIAVSNIITI